MLARIGSRRGSYDRLRWRDHNPPPRKGPLLGSRNRRAEDQGIALSLITPDTIRTLQRQLYAKAKQEPAYRVYALYDKISRADILSHAWRQVRTHGGSPGIDGVTFEAIERGEGIAGFLRALLYKPPTEAGWKSAHASV